MLPSPHDLEYFIETAQAENLSRAAERLGISQPSLSLSVKRLEETLGTQLLLRSKTGVKLTPSGQRFLAQSRNLLQEWEKIRSITIESETEISGRYSIGCHPSVGLYTLSSFLPQLLKQYPQLEFKLSHDLSRKITEEVIRYKIDFGIVVNPVQHPDLVIQELMKDEVTLWKKKGKNSPLQDPETDEAVLICDQSLVQTQTLEKKLEKKGMKFRRIIHSSNLEVITQLTESGAGIGILPGRVAQKQKNSPLIPLSNSLPRFLDRICLVYRADAPKTLSFKQVTKTIKRTLAS